MSSPSTVLERELGLLLTADAEMQQFFGGVVPVFSYVAETQASPYIVYNETRLEGWDDDKKLGGEHTILISVRSAGESEAFVKDVLYRIRSLWARCERRLNLGSYKLILCDLTQTDVQQEADGQAYRGTAQYRALTGGHN